MAEDSLNRANEIMNPTRVYCTECGVILTKSESATALQLLAAHKRLRHSGKPVTELSDLTPQDFLQWLAEDLYDYGGMLSHEALVEIERRILNDSQRTNG